MAIFAVHSIDSLNVSLLQLQPLMIFPQLTNKNAEHYREVT